MFNVYKNRYQSLETYPSEYVMVQFDLTEFFKLISGIFHVHFKSALLREMQSTESGSLGLSAKISIECYVKNLYFQKYKSIFEMQKEIGG